LGIRSIDHNNASARPWSFALGCAPELYTLASLRYDLSKLHAKGLVAKLPNSRRYQLLRHGYSICLVFLKLFERVYAPLQQAFSAPSKQTQSSNAKDELGSTTFINTLSTTSIASSELLALKPRDCTLKREQNSCYEHDNGLIILLKGRPVIGIIASSFPLETSIAQSRLPLLDSTPVPPLIAHATNCNKLMTQLGK
jgi:hypothetical protein